MLEALLLGRSVQEGAEHKSMQLRLPVGGVDERVEMLKNYNYLISFNETLAKFRRK